MLRPDGLLPAHAHISRVQSHFDHVARRHAAALGHGVDEGFVEVEDERLLVLQVGRIDGAELVRGLALGDQRPRRRRRLGVLGQRADGRGRGFELGRDVVAAAGDAEVLLAGPAVAVAISGRSARRGGALLSLLALS